MWQSRSFPGTLATSDGRKVTILEPGVLNPDGGPDFHDALIRIGGTLYRGDVELHVDARSWSTHGHESDPHYNGVILHVVCRSPHFITRTATGRVVPLLEVDGPSALRLNQAARAPQPSLLPCTSWNHTLPVPLIRRWLRIMRQERLQNKVSRLEDRLKELAQDRKNLLCEPGPDPPYADDIVPPSGLTYSRQDLAAKSLWEQLLYEGTMDGLGYAKNRQSMRSLARSLPLDLLRKFSFEDTRTMEALLFGASGLLPDPLGHYDEESVRYILALQNRWREVRPFFRSSILDPADWLFFRMRPVNFPTARLAMMATLLPKLFGRTGFRQCIDIARAPYGSRPQIVQEFEGMYRVRPSTYWETRCMFGPARGRSGAVLGRGRIIDILVNTIVPLLLLYSCVFRDGRVRRGAIGLYAALPPAQENCVTLQMNRDLVKGRFLLRGASGQQALLQLYNAYCRAGRCADCWIGRARIKHRHQGE